MHFLLRRSGALLGVAAALVAAQSAEPASGPPLPASYPAAGQLVWSFVTARAEPNPAAKAVRVLHQFRPDFRRLEIAAVAETTGTDGRPWFRVSLAMRPNGTAGWIPAAAAQLTPVLNRVVVHRATRRIEVWRGSRLLLRALVAVGRPGMETPLGTFYVTARFVPDDPFLGVFALETSAYSRLTEWPGGGKVGIHGTSKPQLLGQAVSHGCVRVSNGTARALKRLAPLGTTVEIVDD
jgi:lipoprotein-anchoring transpeptidase ErfK/SrfK